MNKQKNTHYSDSQELLKSALKEKLEHTFEARIESHENARRLVQELNQAGQEQRARSKQAS